MNSFAELSAENHRITELSNVLNYLVQDRSMCDSQTCCDLFFRYLDELSQHLKTVEQNLYPPILTTGEQDSINLVNNLMQGSQDLKGVVKEYKAHWCHRNQSLKVKDHDKFIGETDDLFGLVLQRLQDEAEKLYPLAKQLDIID